MPGVLDTSVYDEVQTVANEDAFAMAREVAKTEGLPVGISSGAALTAASASVSAKAWKARTSW